MTVENLTAAGMEQMDAEEIGGFLSSQGAGVLGLSDGDVPYLIPMSFGYDGEDCLYFTFVVGEDSKKQSLTHGTDRAAFLVYRAPSPFQWQSVFLTGTLERLPAEKWDDFGGVMDNAWRPEIFEQADAADVRVYQFTIQRRDGYKHTGLPPGFERPDGG